LILKLGIKCYVNNKLQTKLNIRRFTFTLVLGLIINNCFSKTLVTDTANIDSSSVLVNNDSLAIGDTTSLPLSKNGPETKVEYTAKDSIELDNANQILHLYGNATVNYGEMSIEADMIIIYLETNKVSAFGKKDSTGKIIEKVRFQDGEEFFLAPQMNYNFKSQKGKIRQIYTQEGDLHLHAKQAKKMPDNNIFVKHGKITTCDHENPHFYFSASKLKVIPGKVMVAGPTHLVIRDFHTPIWVPFGIFPNNSEKQSGIIIPSQSNLAGQAGISEFGYHWAVNDFLHLEFLSSIYFGGSFQLSADAQYLKKYKYKGNLALKHNNTISGIAGITGHSILKDYNLIWNHVQDRKAHPKSSFKAGVTAKTGTYNQTQLVTQNNVNSFVQSANSSQITWGWNEKWGGLSVFSRFDQNFSTKITKLTAPSMNLNVTKRKLVGLLQVSGNVSLVNTLSAVDSVFVDEWQEVMKNGMKATTTFDIGQSYTIPLPILKYFRFSMPTLTVNSYANSKYINKDVVADTLQESVIKKVKLAYDFKFGGFGVNTKAYGMYKLKEGMFFKAFRHTITPGVTMSYTPDFYIDAQDINRKYIDPTTGKEVEYSIYENRDYSVHSPTARESWRLNYSILNNLQAQMRTLRDTVMSYKKINLITGLDLTGSYDFLAEEFNWSDVRIGLNTNPGFLKTLNFSAVVSPYALDSTGTKINTLLWDSIQQVGRLTRFEVNTRVALKKALFVKTTKNNPSVFKWNMDIGYTFRYEKPTSEDANLTNVLSLSGAVTLSENWKFSYSAPVRIIQRDLDPLTTNLSIVRKLHCWEMLVTWFPISTDSKAQYTFTIRPKSGILADLKYEKKRTQESLF
jgi:uncharacterized C2H2 Zn-finger protein